MNSDTVCGGTASEAAKMLESRVDELERAAIVRYQNWRGFGETIAQAARWADARARLDIALSRES